MFEKSEKHIEIGEKYMAVWRNGIKQPVEIIEIRPTKKVRETSMVNKDITMNTTPNSPGSYTTYLFSLSNNVS